jgi:hypothetical protein
MSNGNIVIGDGNGNLNWYDKYGCPLKIMSGSSGIVLMATDWNKSMLCVSR